jgi:hypothetical protein
MLPMLPIANADDIRQFRHLRGKVDWQIVIVEDSRCERAIALGRVQLFVVCRFRCFVLLAVGPRYLP